MRPGNPPSSTSIPRRFRIRTRNESREDRREFRFGKDNLKKEATADGQDQNDHQRFDVTKTFVLQVQDREHIERGNADTDYDGDFKQKIERDR